MQYIGHALEPYIFYFGQTEFRPCLVAAMISFDALLRLMFHEADVFGSIRCSVRLSIGGFWQDHCVKFSTFLWFRIRG